MADSASQVVAGEVTRAVRDSVTRRRPDRRRATIWALSATRHRGGRDRLADAAIPLLELLSSTTDHEIVTIIEGEGAGAADTRRITEWLGEHHPGVGGRGASRRPAAVPLSVLHRVSPGSTTSLPRLAAIGVDRLRGVGPKHLEALREHRHRVACWTC